LVLHIILLVAAFRRPAQRLRHVHIPPLSSPCAHCICPCGHCWTPHWESRVCILRAQQVVHPLRAHPPLPHGCVPATCCDLLLRRWCRCRYHWQWLLLAVPGAFGAIHTPFQLPTCPWYFQIGGSATPPPPSPPRCRMPQGRPLKATAPHHAPISVHDHCEYAEGSPLWAHVGAPQQQLYWTHALAQCSRVHLL
jgi:hypothetical protein